MVQLLVSLVTAAALLAARLEDFGVALLITRCYRLLQLLLQTRRRQQLLLLRLMLEDRMLLVHG